MENRRRNGHDGEERGTSLMWPCASSTILISANRYLLGSTGLRDSMDILFRLSACFGLPLSLFMKWIQTSFTPEGHSYSSQHYFVGKISVDLRNSDCTVRLARQHTSKALHFSCFGHSQRLKELGSTQGFKKSGKVSSSSLFLQTSQHLDSTWHAVREALLICSS